MVHAKSTHQGLQQALLEALTAAREGLMAQHALWHAAHALSWQRAAHAVPVLDCLQAGQIVAWNCCVEHLSPGIDHGASVHCNAALLCTQAPCDHENDRSYPLSQLLPPNSTRLLKQLSASSQLLAVCKGAGPSNVPTGAYSRCMQQQSNCSCQVPGVP